MARAPSAILSKDQKAIYRDQAKDLRQKISHAKGDIRGWEKDLATIAKQLEKK